MAKLKPIRLKEVVYTLSPFEQSVMSGLWKHGPQNFIKQVKEKGFKITAFLILPVVGAIAYAKDYKEREKLGHRY